MARKARKTRKKLERTAKKRDRAIDVSERSR